MTIRPIPQKVISEAKLPGRPNEGSRTDITDKKGREWTEITYDHGLSWKVKIGALAVLASFGTVFLGLISETIRNLWLKAISGKEIFIIKKEKVVPQTETIDQLGTKKFGKVETKLEGPKKTETENSKTKEVSESVKKEIHSEIETDQDKQEKDLNLKHNKNFKADNQTILTASEKVEAQVKKPKKKRVKNSKTKKINESAKEHIHTEIETDEDKQEKNLNLKENSNLTAKNQPTLTEKKVEINKVETKEDLMKKQILDDFGLEMVEALGGVDKVMQLPIIENWDTTHSTEHFTAPIMRGYSEKTKEPFLLFCYVRYHRISIDSSKEGYDLNHPEVEYLGRDTKDSKGWVGAILPLLGELNLGFKVTKIVDGTFAAICMFDRIERLRKGELLGSLQRYTRKGQEILFVDKNDLDRPTNAYLKKDEDLLSRYMKLNTIHYERDPLEGSEIVLWDPSKSVDENNERIKQDMPGLKVIKTPN